MKTQFIQLTQFVYFGADINKETGENITVYVETNINNYDEAIDMLENTLPFDFETKVMTDSGDSTRWYFDGFYNLYEVMERISKDCSVIFLDGKIINR